MNTSPPCYDMNQIFWTCKKIVLAQKLAKKTLRMKGPMINLPMLLEMENKYVGYKS
jgi:hypothetical protein